MDVDVVAAEERRVDPPLLRVRTDVGQRGPGGFLHHVAQLARQRQPLSAGHLAGFDEHDLAAGRGPGQADRHAGVAGPFRRLREVLGRAQVPVQVLFGDPEGRGLPLGDRAGRLAGDRADLAFEVAQARLPGIVGNDAADRAVVEPHAVGGQPVGVQLPGDEVAPRDLDLLLLRVAGQLDDLHAVAQRRGYAARHVGRGHEHDVGQVEGQVDVVIGKGVVLLRVEHFEQRRGGVSPEVPPELVDLV